MKINNIDIAAYNAKQLTVDIKHNISNNSSWNNKSINPVFFSPQLSFVQDTITILFKGSSRDEILLNISKARTIFSKDKNLIELDKYSKNFVGSLTEFSIEKTKSKHSYIVTTVFVGYWSDKEYTVIDNPANINCLSTIKVPCIVTITPIKLDLVNYTLDINNRTVTIKNLTLNIPIILNGEDGTFKEKGINKFRDIDLWEPVYLDIGNNIFTYDKEKCNVTIKYKNMYK